MINQANILQENHSHSVAVRPQIKGKAGLSREEELGAALVCSGGLGGDPAAWAWPM